MYSTKLNIALLILLLSFYSLLGQKKQLQYDALPDRPSIMANQITNDGKFVLYVIDSAAQSTLYIQDLDNAYFTLKITGPQGSFYEAAFTEDSRNAVFIRPGDTLSILNLSSYDETRVPNCTGFTLPRGEKSQWILCQLTNSDLTLYNSRTKQRIIFPEVTNYQLSKNGKTLILTEQPTEDQTNLNILKQVDLPTGKTSVFWNGGPVSHMTIDDSGCKIAFISQEGRQGTFKNKIWHFNTGMNGCQLLVDSLTKGLGDGFSVDDKAIQFSPDGARIFFHVIKSIYPNEGRTSNGSSVDIWNYKDRYLQPEQLKNPNRFKNRSYLAVLNLAEQDRKIIRLQDETTAPYNIKFNTGENNNYILTQTEVNSSEAHSKESERPDIYLTSTNDGSSKCVIKKLRNGSFDFSPGGQYAYWYDGEANAYFTYNIETGKTTNISKNIRHQIHNEIWESKAPSIPYGRPIWMTNDKCIMIYDRYDIWKVDPTGNSMPVNITNEYGRKHKTILRFVHLTTRKTDRDPEMLDNNTALLCAFNEENKENGFYKLKLNVANDPILLTMQQNVFYFPENLSFVILPTFLIKSKDKNKYLLNKMSVNKVPNLVITEDFKNFKGITALDPYANYNLATSELVHWNTFDGRIGTGILYKPENFNPAQKYPVLLYCYERLSDGLNVFLEPELCLGPINIALFVSQGYLVFCPDIHYTVGEVGQSVSNYVESAAKFMAEKSWVNREKMGIQGHSFGGYEVNYLITKTNLFAAAASAAGPTNLISYSGLLRPTMRDGHDYLILAQNRMGVSLWEDRERYIKNSPIFNVDKVTTPLLLMHNKKDVAVDWSQAVEFFTALRYLKKKVWMLQYDNGGHVLVDDKDKLDYTTRLFQFFDHYLKDKPAPKWMTVGVPGVQKGIDSGLQYDTIGTNP